MSIGKIKSQLSLLKMHQNSNYGNNITTIDYSSEYIKLKEKLKRLKFIENRKNKINNILKNINYGKIK